MPSIERFAFSISPLSPLHLGTGFDLNPLCMTVHNGRLYEFQTEKWHALLSESQKRRFLELASQGGLDALRSVRRFFHETKEICMAQSRASYPVPPDYDQKFQQEMKALPQKTDASVINELAVMLTAREPYSLTPFISGSAIKGALRTAVLNHIASSHDAPKNINRTKGDNTSEYQKVLLGYEKIPEDAFRHIRIEDAHAAAARPLMEVLYSINVKRRSDQISNLANTLLCVSPLQYASFHSSLNALLNLESLKDLNSKLRIPQNIQLFEYFQNVCNQFYGSLLRQQIGQMKRMQYLDPIWLNTIQEMFFPNGIEQAPVIPKGAFLLRLGRYCGAESLTVEKGRSILIRRGKNEKTFESESTTWWMAFREKKSAPSPKGAPYEPDRSRRGIPFGWVLVHPPDMKLPPLEKALGDRLQKEEAERRRVQEEIHGLLESQTTLVAQEQKIRLQEEARRAQEEETRHIEEEARRQRDAELEKLGPEMRSVAEFRIVFEEAKKQKQTNPNGPFGEKRSKFLNEAQKWTGREACQEAARLLRETYRITGYPSKKEKAAKIQEILQKLETP